MVNGIGFCMKSNFVFWRAVHAFARAKNFVPSAEVLLTTEHSHFLSKFLENSISHNIPRTVFPCAPIWRAGARVSINIFQTLMQSGGGASHDQNELKHSRWFLDFFKNFIFRKIFVATKISICGKARTQNL